MKTKKTVTGGLPATVYYIEKSIDLREANQIIQRLTYLRRASSLFANSKMGTSIFEPTCIITIKAERSLFAIAYSMNTV